MKKVLFLFMGVLLIGLSSAAIFDLGVFEQDTTIQLIQTCNNCTFNNISNILLPNGTIILGEVAMEKDDTFYNFTFNRTGNLGQHIVNGFGDPDGDITTFEYVFSITPTGQNLDTPQSILVIGLILILIALTVFFFNASHKTESVPFKVFFGALGFLFIMLTVGISINSIQQLMLVGSVFSGTFSAIYTLVLALVSAGGIGLMIYIIIVALRQFRRNSGAVDKDDDD